MNRLSAFVLLLLLISVASHGQGSYQHQIKPPAVVPPSPDAAALGKYGSIPVGLHTGIPKISIPLHVVKAGSLELPISLNYHAAGIKTSETSSWIGMGWTLDCGGAVSESVVGKPDKGGFLSRTNLKSFHQIDWVNDFNYLKAVADGGDFAADYESDFYFYSFPGQSGKFVYRQNQGTANPFLIPEAPIKVITLSNGYKIIDERGTIYRFNYPETTSYTENSVFVSYQSAYYLTSIRSADGKDSINLAYTLDQEYIVGQTNYQVTIGQQCPQHTHSPPWHGYSVSNYYSSARGIKTPRLNAVTFPTGKIEFITDNTRSDIAQKRLQEIKIWAKEAGGTFTHKKSYVLGEDYFLNSSGQTVALRLPNLTETDPLAAVARVHAFDYYDSVKMPLRNTNAQDWWGYYNGQTGNGSLIATTVENYMGTPYPIGDANRNPNAVYMKAGIIKRITYPTGGSTEFTFEPHYYAGGTTTTPNSRTAQAGAYGNVTDLFQDIETFTVSASGYATVSVQCSNVTDGVPFYSYVGVRKQNGPYLLEHRYDPAIYQPFLPQLQKTFYIYLEAGNTYELTTMAKGNSDFAPNGYAAFSNATITWMETTPGVTAMAGGLRIKEMRDYPAPGITPIVKLYKYGKETSSGVFDGNGTLLSPVEGLRNARQRTIFWNSEAVPPQGLVVTMCEGERMTITGSPALDLTSLSGAPVGYGTVTVYEGGVTAPNGKHVFKFDVKTDELIGAPQAYNNGQFQSNDSWMGGDEIYNAVYTGNTSNKVKETTTVSSLHSREEIIGTKIGWAIQFEGDGIPSDLGILTCCNHDFFYAFDYPIHTGFKKVINVDERLYASTDPAKFVETKTTYKYSNINTNHQQLSEVTVSDSEGSTQKTKYWYPADYGNADNMETLRNANIIAVPVKEELYRRDSLVAGKVTRYNNDGKPVEIHQYETLKPQAPPVHNPASLFPSGYAKRLDISYDATTKRLNKTQMSDDQSTVYLWGYNNAHPIAMIVNGNTNNVAATSFEYDGKGGWSYSGAPLSDIVVKTGSSYYKLSTGNITKSLPAGKYKLEYWAKGTVNLSGGSIATVRTAPADANGWILYEKEVTMSVTTTLTLSGNTTAFIDELRVYPVNAQVTTYTYDVANGIRSVTDPNNLITTYEYDTFGRLRLQRDPAGNVVKTYDYHYKGR